MTAVVSGDPLPSVRTAEVVLPCDELGPTLDFFTDRLGFRVQSVIPADDPRAVVISGYGVRLRLQRGGQGSAGAVRLACDDPGAVASGQTELLAPNGTQIELVPADPPVVVPKLVPSLSVARAADATWVQGRAGMQYRDLIPDRQGGPFIASHIQIPGGGPVPDYVHFHRIRFQLIYCHRGWVKVVYEDQGPPFLLEPGDAVLQPPQIRHRVLEASEGLEVVEVGCPAEHVTCADHSMSLPTDVVRPERDFGGQRFVRHQAKGAAWVASDTSGFEARDTGIAAATDGLAGVRVLRRTEASSPPMATHDRDLTFCFVLAGAATLDTEGGEPRPLATADAFVVPAGLAHRLADASPDLSLLEVTLPAAARP